MRFPTRAFAALFLAASLTGCNNESFSNSMNVKTNPDGSSLKTETEERTKNGKQDDARRTHATTTSGPTGGSSYCHALLPEVSTETKVRASGSSGSHRLRLRLTSSYGVG